MITIREAGQSDVATIRDLLRRYAASLPFDLAFQGFEAELAALPEPYVAPRGMFLLACDGPTVVGLGAFRPLVAEIAEIKRMYLVPAIRGQGPRSAPARSADRPSRPSSSFPRTREPGDVRGGDRVQRRWVPACAGMTAAGGSPASGSRRMGRIGMGRWRSSS